VVLALTVILVAAKLGGELAVRVGQSAVLGELVVGCSGKSHAGRVFRSRLPVDGSVHRHLARIGGARASLRGRLESTVGQMLKVGLPSLLVRPWESSRRSRSLGCRCLAAPRTQRLRACLPGATLWRYQRGYHRPRSKIWTVCNAKARIILGAAVLDDVMGLVVCGRHRDDRRGGSGGSFSS